MAHLLKQRGHTKVTVLDSEPRVGGKSRTVYVRDLPMELGTTWLKTTYRRLPALLTEIGRNDVRPVLSSEIYLSQPGSQSKISVAEWVAQMTAAAAAAASDGQSSEPPTPLTALAAQYHACNEALYGRSPHRIPQAPGSEASDLLSKNFAEYLHDVSLDRLTAAYFLTGTMFGYGFADSIPAYYGNYWMDAATISAMSNFGNPQPGGDDPISGRVETPVAYMLANGFEFLWRDLADKSSADLLLGVTITGIERSEAGGLRNSPATIRFVRNGLEERLECDFVILAIPAKQALQLLDQPTPRELDNFSGQVFQRKYANTLVEAQNPFSGKGLIFWPENMFDHSSDRVTSIRETSAMLDPSKNDSARSLLIVGQSYPTTVNYDPDKSLSELEQFLAKNGYVISDVLERQEWDYFPRFDAAAIERGAPWDAIANQGNMNTWFIGSSVSFESVDAVLEFNHFMIDKANEFGHSGVEGARMIGVT
ncbi:hypothetical protein MSIMFI_00857 [Mycobacterium simulans]|nr:hypothetical protein MSIMFI_00857 [Mycobacterium simulans]